MNLFRLCLLGWLAAAACGCQRTVSENPLVGIQIQDRNGLTETISAPDRLEAYGNVDFFSSQPYKKVVRVYREEGKSHTKISTYHPNGFIWQYLEGEEMRAHGAYREWHPNGQLKIEANVIGGPADLSPASQREWLFDGMSQVFDEQGNRIAQIPYKKGCLEGPSLYFYPSGILEKELPYQKNALEGEAREYLPDGKLRAIAKYKKGIKEGTSLGFFPSGELAWEEDHTDGLLRKAAYYSPQGDQIGEIENGRGVQAVCRGEVLFQLVEYRYGRPEGLVRQLAPTGELQFSYSLKNSRKEGEEIEYYLLSEREDGKTEPLPKLSVDWHDNAVHGTVKTWYKNGRLQSQREFCRNAKSGPSLAWYPNGALMLIEEYEEDRLLKGQYFKLNHREPVSSILNGTGTAFLYDEKGVLIRKVIYEKGRPIDPEK